VDIDRPTHRTSAQSLRELHSEGITREQIEHALRIMPFHPAMVRAVQRLKTVADPQTTFFCLSNANSIYISTILESKGLDELFTEIVTNPAHWEDGGLLHLQRRIGPEAPQHNCAIGCSPNMCKGEELDAFLKRHDPTFDRIYYVGDGSNDFCPALRLRSQDVLFCRRHRGLEQRIAKEGKQSGIKCEVQYWAGAWELEESFSKL